MSAYCLYYQSVQIEACTVLWCLPVSERNDRFNDQCLHTHTRNNATSASVIMLTQETAYRLIDWNDDEMMTLAAEKGFGGGRRTQSIVRNGCSKE